MLDLEPLIKDRLQDRVTDLRGVHSAVGLNEQQAAGKPTPCVFVHPYGYRVAQVTGQASGARLTHTWLVVVAVRNVAEILSGAAARGEADDLIRQVFGALTGWQPRPGCGPLTPVTPPNALYESGLLLYPLAFESAHVIKGDPS